MGALDSLLSLVESQRARGLVIAVGEPPQLVFDEGSRPLSMPALAAQQVEAFAREVGAASATGSRYETSTRPSLRGPRGGCGAVAAPQLRERRRARARRAAEPVACAKRRGSRRAADRAARRVAGRARLRPAVVERTGAARALRRRAPRARRPDPRRLRHARAARAGARRARASAARGAGQRGSDHRAARRRHSGSGSGSTCSGRIAGSRRRCARSGGLLRGSPI